MGITGKKVFICAAEPRTYMDTHRDVSNRKAERTKVDFKHEAQSGDGHRNQHLRDSH